MSNRAVSKVVIAPPGPLAIKVKALAEGHGLVVLTVDVKSPLLTKINPGDWIVSMDGEDVSAVSDLAAKKDEGRLLGVLTVQDQNRIQTENAKAVLGPPIHLLEYTVEPVGACLGLVLDEKHVVVQVCERSPMEGKIWKKDRIFAVNGVGVSTLDMTQLATYLTCLQENYEMVILKVERDPKRKKNPQKILRSLKQPPETAVPGDATAAVPPKLYLAMLEKKNNEWTHEFLPPGQGQAMNEKMRVPQKKPYPALTEYGISLGTDEESMKLRQTLLSELILWNEKHKVEHEFTFQDARSRLFWVSCDSGPTLDDETPIKQVIQACRQSNMFDETINGIVKYFGLRSYEKGLDLALTYFAHTQAEAYEKLSKVAQQVLWEQETQRKRHVAAKERRKKKLRTEPVNIETGEDACREEKDDEDLEEKKPEADPVVLPGDYQDYDGTGDFRWNLRYMDLIKYYHEHGDCMVTTREVPLGKWVAWQRESYRKKYAALTDRRKELLDSLGFVWEAKHANRKPHVDTGDPRLNKALATRIVFGQQFGDRQIFALSGFSTEELEEVRNPSHQWRNGLVVLKKRLDARLKSFAARSKKEDDGLNNLPRRKTYSAVQEIIATLQDVSKTDRYAQVYGEQNAKLLQEYVSIARTWQQDVNSSNKSSISDLAGTNITELADEDETRYKDGDEEENQEKGDDGNYQQHPMNPVSPPTATLNSVEDATNVDSSTMYDAAAGIAGGAAAAWNTTTASVVNSDHAPEQQEHQQQQQQLASPWRRGYVLPTATYGDSSGFPE